MSISDYIKRKEYVVTVNNFEDLDSIYADLETEGKSPPNIDLLRSVECLHRRSTSRNTHYFLTDLEVEELRKDPRIKTISIAPHYLGIKAGTTAVEQTSTAWDKSTSTSGPMKNWGLLRCTEGTQRSGWGGAGYSGGGTGTAAQTGTITLTETGKNVDVVICDLNGLVWDHPEFEANADGTGGTRAVQYNWYQHSAEIGNGANSTYTIASPNNLRLLGVLSYTTTNMVLQDQFVLSNAFGSTMPDAFGLVIVDFSGAAIHTTNHRIYYSLINKVQR